jgi:hypothetical protein
LAKRQNEPRLGVSLNLTNDEALVLGDFLARFSNSGSLEIVDQAEERALWNVQCLLEEALDETLDPAYDRLVAEARGRLRDRLD